MTLQELRATLELFSRGKLQEGASAVLVMAKLGQRELTFAAGVRSRDGGEAVQPTDRFPVDGQIRTMMAVSVLKLVEEARLGLDDALTTHLPEALGAANPVTIRQLLGNTTGLPASQADTLLGALLEQLRGAPLEAVLRTDTLTPLGLKSTALLGPEDPVDLVHGYVQVDGATVDVSGPAHRAGTSTGRLVSTVEDTTRFQSALLRGELLSPESLVAMKGPVSADYGLGLDHWDDHCTNGSYYGHAGDAPGYGSIAMSSADGNRQVTIFMAYPPLPITPQPSALALEMTAVAQLALNAGCRFQFG